MNSRSSQIKEAIKRRSRVIGFTLLGCCIALAVWAGAAVIWQPDNNYPQPNDPTARSLQKINSILKVWEVAGYPVGATFSGTVNTKTNMVLRSNTNDVYAEVEDGQVWVNVKAGSVTTSFPSGSTNNTGALNLAPTNVINVNVTNLPSGTSDANAVVVTNATGGIYVANTFNPAVTNSAATALYLQQSTNTVGGFTLITNLTITNYLGTDIIAGDALNTNAIEIGPIVRANGGTGVALGFTYCRSTNILADTIDMLICSQPIVTWPNASSAAVVNNTNITDGIILGTVTFGTNTTANGREWNQFGNTEFCTQDGRNVGLKPGTNTLFLYFKARVALTNGANDSIKLTVSQD